MFGPGCMWGSFRIFVSVHLGFPAGPLETISQQTLNLWDGGKVMKFGGPGIQGLGCRAAGQCNAGQGKAPSTEPSTSNHEPTVLRPTVEQYTLQSS